MSERAVSLLDPEVQKCPFPAYARLRKEAPVQFMPDLGVFFVSNYDLGRRVLSDSKRFTKTSPQNDGRRHTDPNKAAQQVLLTKDIGLPSSMMAQKEGAEHRAYRAIVDPYFQGGAVKKLADHITSTALALLDNLVDQRELEVVSAFAIPLPVYVIADILGLPKSEYLTYRRWSDAMVTFTAMTVSDDVAVAAAESLVEMHSRMLEEIRQRRREPQSDLLTVLAQAQYQGRPLSDKELCGFTDELLVAGNETTTGTLAAGLLHLAQHPELQRQLRDNPPLVGKFAEEALRTSTPLQVSYRYALNDTTIGDVPIPAGAKILIGLVSANRDDCAFSKPETLDTARSNSRSHLTFGAGEHYCLGAELARLELRIAFRLWVERYEVTELAQAAETIAYPGAMAIRVPLAYKVRVVPKAS
jgi:cytochrome P450